ncbi:MAG: hypothetical protein WC830_15910 [Burkholderiales bacterium]|jgi:hypothetical protein
MMRHTLLLAIALLLSACAGLRIAGPPDSQLEQRQVIQLINYAQRVAAMTPEQQRREYGAGNQAFASDANPNNRMQLALLLAIPGSGVQDAARAARLLEPLTAAGDGASPMHALASLLYAQLSERAREHKRAEHMHDQLEARKEAEHNMRKQLEALKDVERAILQRTQASQPRRR